MNILFVLFNHPHSFTSDIKNTTVDTNQEFKQVLFHVEFKELKIFDKDINIQDTKMIKFLTTIYKIKLFHKKLVFHED